MLVIQNTIPYLTITYNTIPYIVMGRTVTAGEIELSNQMMQYWANFAKYNNPNAPGLAGTSSHPFIHTYIRTYISVAAVQ